MCHYEKSEYVASKSRKCCKQVEAPPLERGFPKPFIVNGVAHFYSHMRGNAKSKKEVEPEQPAVATWADIESRARQFWEQKRAGRTTDIASEPAEVAA